MSLNGNPRRRSFEADRPDRAVIDIGSNTVRLVVYSGSRRVPDVWLNEKVTARLGRDLAETGCLPEKSVDLALTTLARFAAILEDLDVTDIHTVATAAVRDAADGRQFLDRVRELGLSPRLLSGEEEARISATGVTGAFPGARGMVADLGGGSLELVPINDGQVSTGISLPLGTLRLPALRGTMLGDFRKSVTRMVKQAAPQDAAPTGGPLFMVGGTWRAMAAYWMHSRRHPLSDPHGLALNAEQAAELADDLALVEDSDPLKSISGLPSSRAPNLPDAAALLRVLLAELRPDGLVFSSWGLREGLLFDQLPPAARAQDPLLAAIAHFTVPRGASYSIAALIAAWTATAATGRIEGGERLRLAATLLCLAAARIEPNLRLRHSCEWAMDKRWLALGNPGRAIITAALRGFLGKPALLPELQYLAQEAQLREAAGWGLAIRLCRRLGAGSRVSLMTSALRREDGRLILWLDPSRAQLATDMVANDLRNLGNWLDCQTELRVEERIAGQ